MRKTLQNENRHQTYLIQAGLKASKSRGFDLTDIVTEALDSAATFRRYLPDKMLYIILNQIDLVLTVLATGAGYPELNPWMRSVLHFPALVMVVKVVLPVGIAWLIPGKWLRPASLVLLLVIAWNVKELVIRMMA